jgi:hypothetical protein
MSLVDLPALLVDVASLQELLADCGQILRQVPLEEVVV